MTTKSPTQLDALVEIRDGEARAVVAPASGGAIASFTWTSGSGTVDWMRRTSAAALAAQNAEEFSCFPLVPYSNRIRDSRFSFGGRAIDLKGERPGDPHFEHGFGWRNSWNVVDQAANRVTIRYLHERDAWPWRFAAEQKISLTGGALTIAMTVQNLDDSDMPTGMGLHPYFPATPRAQLNARVDGMWRTDAEILPTVHGAVLPDADPGAGLVIADAALDTVFSGWDGKARIDWPERRASLTIEAETPLRNLVVYTPAGADHFCVEPVSNATDAFNMSNSDTRPTGVFILAPYERRSTSVRFSPSTRRWPQ